MAADWTVGMDDLLTLRWRTCRFCGAAATRSTSALSQAMTIASGVGLATSVQGMVQALEAENAALRRQVGGAGQPWDEPDDRPW